MSKIAVLIHGWPQPIPKSNPLYQFLEQKNYEIISPYFFNQKQPYTIQNIKDEIKSQLIQRPPEIMVGYSLGGLVIPHLALSYPKSKLIFLSTGPSFQPKSPLLKFGLIITKSPLGNLFLKLVDSIPIKVRRELYQLSNPPATKQDSDSYKKSVTSDFEYIVKIPYQKNLEIVKFVSEADNESLLATLPNKSLIIGSTQDWMMPGVLSQRLHKLLKNSQLILTSNHHSQNLNPKTLERIKEFLL